MISTTLSGATTLFNYNGDGVRLKQVIAGVPTTYTQDIVAPLPVVLQAKTGTIATQYLFSMGTRPIAQYTSSAFQYLLADGLGSVRQIADASGHVILAESYQPYGMVLNSSGSGSSIFAYAGEQADNAGLIYLRARYLNPMLGIFMSRDPWSGDQLRPGSMNGFWYVDGNPMGNVDPTGICTNCGFATLARVNSNFGLNLRSAPTAGAPLLETLSYGSWVFVIFSQLISGDINGPWRAVAKPWDTRTTIGFAVDEGLERVCNLWEPNCPPHGDNGGPGPNPPPPGPVERLTYLPVDSPSYDNGYGSYDWGSHDGYDISSGSGNPTVYSMGSGVVDSMDTPNTPGTVCACAGNAPQWYLIRMKMDAGYYIKYVHIQSTSLCIGDRVNAGTMLGEYAQIGDSTYPHVHVRFELPKYQKIDPAPYWPNEAPTNFRFGNPTPFP
jgi:RHS repeat-associated protein